MDALIVYPENKEQLTALKAVMKAMKVSFEQKSGVIPDYVIAGVKQSLDHAEKNDTTPYTGINEMLGLKRVLRFFMRRMPKTPCTAFMNLYLISLVRKQQTNF